MRMVTASNSSALVAGGDYAIYSREEGASGNKTIAVTHQSIESSSHASSHFSTSTGHRRMLKFQS